MPPNENQNAEIESELYAITNTIINLSERYQRGDLKDNFFQKSIKKTTTDLLKIHLKLRDQNLILSDLLERTNLSQKYYEALDIINKVSALNFADVSSSKESSFTERMRTSLLELPRITSKITSAFITILDALKLEAFNDVNILDSLFNELSSNLRKFPGSKRVELEINKLHNYIRENKNKIIKNKNFRILIEEDLYTLFKDFQRILNIES